MPNAAFNSDKSTILMATSFAHTQGSHLREPRQMAAQQFLRVLRSMKNDKALTQLTESMPKEGLIKFIQTTKADSDPVAKKGQGINLTNTRPGQKKAHIHQTHLAK